MDQGLLQTGRMVNKPGTKASLDAQHSPAGGIFGNVLHHPQQLLLRIHMENDAAAYPAVRAGGLHPARYGRRFPLRAQGLSGAGCHTLAAGGTDGTLHEVVPEYSHTGLMSFSDQGNGADVLHLLAGIRAAPAENAKVSVQDKQRFTL